MTRAEELAAELSTISQWVEVAKVWMRVMGEPGEARRCVAEAEKLLEKQTAQEYIMLAEGVAVLGDPELPVQYLDKAESLIDGTLRLERHSFHLGGTGILRPCGEGQQHL